MDHNTSRNGLGLYSLTVFLLVTATVGANGPADRRVADGVFISESKPQLQLRVDPRFEYIGASSFVLEEKADVERHHWVTTQDGNVTALIVLQFEGLRNGVEGEYSFSIPGPEEIAGSNYRFAPERVQLGNFDFVHNTWAYDNGSYIRDNHYYH
jgi:hypothetical protein